MLPLLIKVVFKYHILIIRLRIPSRYPEVQAYASQLTLRDINSANHRVFHPMPFYHDHPGPLSSYTTFRLKELTSRHSSFRLISAA